ncbi:NSFL1 cofactor p47 [Zerene cesonia]|uniref:NSFL1 cofactor p47 n=1 Tax=Zerene cesonia TaxID=33412 RepID=UPI0018E53246|nr:NSFL1 cofactor p47 [Zerene cesonia]XP_038217971.1 NSFL1 cofactor p47 [Zerene cesonia]
MASNREETMRQFCDVTGADENRSRFFLESSNWQLEVALSSFYENGGNVDEAPANAAPVSASPQPMSESDLDSPPGSPEKAQKKDKKKKTNTKFATLDTLQQDSSSEEDEGQAFYAGGSERSGQQILGPGKGRKDIVTEMFKSIRERGAVVFEDEPSSTSRGRGGVFSGVGYRLGQTADDHEQITPGNAAQSDQPRSVRLRLYREGFTVDNGPIRQYGDQENAEFLSCIRRGEIPPELSGGGEVRVSLEDRRHEECPRTMSKTQAFTGKGHLLGSPTPATVGATVPVASQAGDRAANQRAAQEAMSLDEASPVTTVQFRLADGSRLTGRFNHTHTVEDLYLYVSIAEPSYQIQPFVLLTTFPSVELSDRSATLGNAKLLNTTVLQRLK